VIDWILDHLASTRIQPARRPPDAKALMARVAIFHGPAARAGHHVSEILTALPVLCLFSS